MRGIRNREKGDVCERIDIWMSAPFFKKCARASSNMQERLWVHEENNSKHLIQLQENAYEAYKEDVTMLEIYKRCTFCSSKAWSKCWTI